MLEPVLEEQPKWLLLREVVEEVQAQRGAIASLAPAAPAADGPPGGGGAGGVQVSCHCLAAHACNPCLFDSLRAWAGAGTRHTCTTPPDLMCMHYLHA